MRLLLLIFFLSTTSIINVSGQTRKVVVKEYEDGKPHIVFYIAGKGEKAEKIKEEGYFPNGNLEYSGGVKKGVEHGEWTYYFEDGTIKVIEQWKNGVEDGTWKEYHPDGKLAREIIYKNGKIIQTIVNK